MKELNIGQIISHKRKEKGITQDQLANFIGVSKASVSKWETGQNYPDIVFLPRLAAYFNISLDELVGYEPQMSDEDIRRTYLELRKAFAVKPFAEAANLCRELVMKYYSCFPLLFQVATVFSNYGAVLKDPDQKGAAITEAKLLFTRTRELSDNSELRRLALQAEVSCELLVNQPQNVVLLLENESRTVMQPSIGVLLSQAQQMMGNLHEAKMAIQESVFDDVIILFYDAISYLSLCNDNNPLFEEVCRRNLALKDTFQLDVLFPAAVLSFYYTAAEGYTTLGNTKEALTMLEAYTKLAAGDIIPLNIPEDHYFTLIKEIQKRQLKENAFVMPELPRDDQTIKQDLIAAILENPVFSVFTGEAQYKILIEKLKDIGRS